MGRLVCFVDRLPKTDEKLQNDIIADEFCINYIIHKNAMHTFVGSSYIYTISLLFRRRKKHQVTNRKLCGFGFRIMTTILNSKPTL